MDCCVPKTVTQARGQGKTQAVTTENHGKRQRNSILKFLLMEISGSETAVELDNFCPLQRRVTELEARLSLSIHRFWNPGPLQLNGSCSGLWTPSSMLFQYTVLLANKHLT